MDYRGKNIFYSICNDLSCDFWVDIYQRDWSAIFQKHPVPSFFVDQGDDRLKNYEQLTDSNWSCCFKGILICFHSKWISWFFWLTKRFWVTFILLLQSDATEEPEASFTVQKAQKTTSAVMRFLVQWCFILLPLDLFLSNSNFWNICNFKKVYFRASRRTFSKSFAFFNISA